MRFPVRLTIALLASALLALAGCGEQAGSSTSEDQLTGTGKTADYDFSSTTLDGAPFKGASLEGKPAVLWFWAPWCSTCRSQAPAVSALAKKYKGRVAVIGVAGLDSESAIRDLATQIPDVTHLVDDEGAVWQHFGVTAQSHYRVIGADGEIMVEGYLDNDELGESVAKLSD